MDKEQYLTKKLDHEKVTVPILKALNEPLVVFDIGSCDGLDSLRYNSLFPIVTIHAFEANEDNFILLTKNTNTRENILANNLALSNKEGKLTFFKSYSDEESKTNWNHSNKSGSLLPPKEHLKIFPNIKFSSGSVVPSATLDAYCIHNHIKKIHLMHIDVQGAEKLVLEGAYKMLKQTLFIWLEASNVELYKDQPLKKDIFNFLEKLEFFCVLDNFNSKAYGDLLFFNKSFFNSLSISQNVSLNLRRIVNGLFSK